MAERITIYCAGSIRTALAEMVDSQTLVKAGPSGVLRRRIAKGARPDIFISADLGHPRALEAAGDYGPVSILTANSPCLIFRPGLSIAGRSPLELMLDPDLLLGTSTPKSDPGGDYAWQVFEKAELVQPGADAALQAKAQTLVGGPNQEFDPSGRHPVAVLLADQRADIFIGYRTTALQVMDQLPGTQFLELPGELAVRAEYGLTLRLNAGRQARKLVDYLLSPSGKAILARHGFQA